MHAAGQESGPGRRVVIVTGCSSGIGLETAVLLAENGFHVCATMRDAGRRSTLEAEAARRGVIVEILQMDVTDEDEVARVVNDVARRHGSIYGAVNNAGVVLRGYFEDLADDEIRNVFDTNLFGTMAVTRAVLPHLRAAGRGRVVIIGSVGGRLGAPGVSAYIASKFALEGFAEALVQEVEPLGVDVSLVTPAVVRTDIWGANRGCARGAWNPESPYHGSFVKEEEWADALLKTAPTRPADVARAVREALTAARPRLRYIVGTRAARVLTARRLLPGELFERVYFRMVRRGTTAGGSAR